MAIFEKEHTIKLPVFGYYFHIVITKDVLRSRKNRDHIFGKVDDSISTLAMCSNGDKNENFSYIFIKATASSGTIAHEVYQALCNMFRYIGADHEEEVVAYHLNYLIDEIGRVKKIKFNKPKK